MSIPTTSSRWSCGLAYAAALIFTLASAGTNLVYGWGRTPACVAPSLLLTSLTNRVRSRPLLRPCSRSSCASVGVVVAAPGWPATTIAAALAALGVASEAQHDHVPLRRRGGAAGKDVHVAIRPLSRKGHAAAPPNLTKPAKQFGVRLERWGANVDQEADFDFAEQSAALAAAVRHSREDGDPAYFDLVIELFALVVGAAHRQGVADEALQLLIQYFDERETILSANSGGIKPTAAGTGTLQ
jgi:hypothetical protein